MALVNETVKAIYARGFGGESAVVVPGSTADQLPSTQSAAGVKEARNHLIASINDQEPNWLFLVGGPGNGKSHEINHVLKQLKLQVEPSDGGLAPRKTSFEYNGSHLLVVNDASIRPNEAQGNLGAGDLALDIRNLFKEHNQGIPTTALICVNRGILIEELAKVPESQSWAKERALIDWINDDGKGCESIQPIFSNDFTKTGRIEGDEGPFIQAVYLDRLSLLEIQPTADEQGRLEAYRVLPLGKEPRLESPAGKLLGRLAAPKYFEEAECLRCPASQNCPFLENARSLRSDAVRLGILDTLRASEVVSGHLCTYRDLWALAAALVIGTDRSEFSIEHPCEWVQRKCSNAIAGESLSKDEIVELARQRFYEAVYPSLEDSVTSGHVEGWPETPPIIDRLRAVDPALDTTGEWAEAIDMAAEGASFQQQPLSLLLAAEPDFVEAVTPLDKALEKFILSPIVSDAEQSSSSQKFDALKWRGISLYRHFGFSMGHAAYRDTVDQWLNLRMRTGPTEKSLPMGTLRSALDQLILPTSEHDNSFCLLPIFDPRVEPIVDPPYRPKWCQALEAAALVSWKLYARGDGIWLRLKVQGHERLVSEFPLDFPLCREALAQCVYNATRNPRFAQGFTELRRTISPRLERVRASLQAASSGIERKLVVVDARLSPVDFRES